MSRAAFIYDDAMSRHELRADHPMRPVRLRYTYDLLQAYGAFDADGAVLLGPREAEERELEWLHTPEYIAAVRNLSQGLGRQEAGEVQLQPSRGQTRSIPGCTMRRPSARGRRCWRPKWWRGGPSTRLSTSPAASTMPRQAMRQGSACSMTPHWPSTIS